MIVGALYLCMYVCNKSMPFADLHWRTAIFFLAYGFLFDLYRIKELRVYLLMHSQNFQLFRTLSLILFLLFLYDGLIHSLISTYKQKHSR